MLTIVLAKTLNNNLQAWSKNSTGKKGTFYGQSANRDVLLLIVHVEEEVEGRDKQLMIRRIGNQLLRQ